MSRRIPTSSPDIEVHLIPILSAATSESWFNVKPNRTGAYTLGLVRADLQGRVTPISRYCRVGLQGWAVDANGRADLGAAFDLVSLACTALEEISGQGIILDAETQSGPVRVTDDITRLEYSYATLLLEVSV